MSTKIYDAYKFDKFYSLSELMNMIDDTRKAVQKKEKEMFYNRMVYQFNFFYNMYLLHTKEELEEIYNYIEVNDKQTNSKKDIYKMILKENPFEKDFNSIMIRIYTLVEENVECASMLKCTMQIIPVGRKLLVLLFGNNNLQKIVKNTLPLEDYHYQNSTDKPENITTKDWDLRRKTWDKALSPDYIPSNHGFNVKLTDSYYPFTIGEAYLSKEDKIELLRAILSTFKVPEQYMINSDKQLEWRKLKKEEISEKIKFLSAQDIKEMSNEYKSLY